MWIYSVRNVLNYSSVVPYASQGRSPAGAGLGLLRSRFWGHRRYSRVLSVKAPALSLVLCILLPLLLVPLLCFVACYNLPKALQSLQSGQTQRWLLDALSARKLGKICSISKFELGRVPSALIWS